MRKVMYKIHEQGLPNEKGGHVYDWKWYGPASFHGFYLTGSGNLPEGVEIGPIALLEKVDGTVIEISVSNLKFLPPPF